MKEGFSFTFFWGGSEITAFGSMENFSRLPDELLLHILSFLNFKEVVRTSVLSRRWRYLYASLSELDLHFSHFVFEEAGQIDLMNVVDRIFFYRDGCPIDKFKFH